MKSYGPNLRIFLALLIGLVDTRGFAKEHRIYNCKPTAETSIAWKDGGLLSSSKFVALAENSDSKGDQVTFVKDGEKAYLKGNNGQTELKGNGEVFFEISGFGNIVHYHLIKQSQGNKRTVLVQMKAYEFGTAATYTTLYDCGHD